MGIVKTLNPFTFQSRKRSKFVAKILDNSQIHLSNNDTNNNNDDVALDMSEITFAVIKDPEDEVAR